VVGITGASGSIYGIRLIQELVLKKHPVDVVITNAGKMVMKEELGVSNKKEMLKLFISSPQKRESRKRQIGRAHV
jgi:4-hydroxy-3-polyprenylbenzoate decarboxylase